MPVLLSAHRILRKYGRAPAEFFLIVLLLAGGAYWGLLKRQNHQEHARQEKIAEALAKATELHHFGNPGESIPFWTEIKELASQDKEPGLYAGAVAGIAWDNFSTCTLDGKLEAIKIFKNYIAEESSAPADIKVKMIMSMLDVFNASHDDHYLQAIFTGGEPWQTFLAQARGEGRLAERLAYEWTLGIYPTALAHYRIAYWYGENLLKNRELSAAEKADYAQKIAGHTQKGDALFERDFKHLLTASQSPVRAVALSLLRAVSHRWLIAAGQEKPERVEALFGETSQLIKKFTDGGKEDRHLRDIPYEFAYHYMSFLLDLYKETRNDDIVRQAETVARGARTKTDNGSPILFARLAQNEYVLHVAHAGQNHGVHYPDYDELVTGARFSAQLRLALQNLGWPAKEFAFK